MGSGRRSLSSMPNPFLFSKPEKVESFTVLVRYTLGYIKRRMEGEEQLLEGIEKSSEASRLRKLCK